MEDQLPGSGTQPGDGALGQHALPPAVPPPPVIPPPRRGPTPPAPSRGRGWRTFALLLLAVLVVSLLYNLGHLASGLSAGGGRGSGGGYGPRLEEVVMEESRARDKIAVIEVNGVIASDASERHGMVEVLRAQFDWAKEDKRVKAVLLKVDSPGGEVLASDEIYRVITEFQAKSGKPVIASMGNVAASGGYYVSAPCRWIVANELTITGSIGVIMQSLNYRGLMNKVGVAPYTFKSGRFKDMLSGMREPNEIPAEERTMVEGLITEIYTKFQNVVAEGRTAAQASNKGQGRGLAPDWKDKADGRVMSGSEALRLGLVDELGNFRTAVHRALLIAGIKEARLVQYHQIVGLADFLRVFGKSEGTVVKVDMGIEAPKLRAGQPYFLAPTFVH